MCIEIMEAFRKAQLTTQGMLILPDLFFLGQEDFIILFGKNAELGFCTVSLFPTMFFRGYLENINRIPTAAGNVSLQVGSLTHVHLVREDFFSIMMIFYLFF